MFPATMDISVLFFSTMPLLFSIPSPKHYSYFSFKKTQDLQYGYKHNKCLGEEPQQSPPFFPEKLQNISPT